MFTRDWVGINAARDAARRASYLPRSAYMKRQNPYAPTSTRQQRFAKIATNPKSLAYRQARQIQLYRQPAGFGTNQQAQRTGGWANPSRMGELKFIDTTPGGDPPLSVAFSAAVLLNGCIPGSLATERIGRKVFFKIGYYHVCLIK